MLDSVDYATLLQYSPRGTSGCAATSRKVKDTIKAGRFDQRFRGRVLEIISENLEQLSPFLSAEVTLIPVPRSSPIRESDMWPSLEIAKMLASFGLGTPASCLIRAKAIKKSSLCFKAEDRPSTADQFDSMVVANYVPTANITLVDDVLTLGRTSLAGASRLAEKFPNATIRVFSLVRTMGFVEEVNILNVQVGTITYNPHTGKCTREP